MSEISIAELNFIEHQKTCEKCKNANEATGVCPEGIIILKEEINNVFGQG